MGKRVGRSLPFAVVAVLVPSFAHAALYTVFATANADINLQEARQYFGPLEQLQGVTASAVMDTNTQAWAQADYGTLRVAAYGEVNGVSHRAGYSDANAVVTDTLTVTGAVPGTPVDLKFSYTVHGSVTSNRPGTPNPGDAWGAGRLQVNSNLGSFDNGFWSYTGTVSYRWSYPAPANDTVTAVLHTVVGDTVSVEYSLNAHTFTNDAHYLVDGQVFLASADLSHTAKLQVESLTPGTSFAAASGTAYVPEPALLAPVLLTASALIRRRRRVAC